MSEYFEFRAITPKGQFFVTVDAENRGSGEIALRALFHTTKIPITELRNAQRQSSRDVDAVSILRSKEGKPEIYAGRTFQLAAGRSAADLDAQIAAIQTEIREEDERLGI